MKFIFMQIDEKELNTVLGFLKEAAVWLRDKKIDYWQDWLDPPEFFKDWILTGLRQKQFHYIVNDVNEVIGMFRLQYDDELFWGERDDRAAYIHSFAIKRSLGGKGTGYEVLRAIEEFVKEKGADYLRLDCGLKIKKLCEYYINYGFKKTGTITVNGEELLLLEKKL